VLRRRRLDSSSRAASGAARGCIGTPSFQHGSGVRERAEQGLVEQFVAQAPDEGFGKGVLHRLARRDVVPGNLVIV
jgi:hypothetical protein